MSQQTALAFLETVRHDPSLRMKLCQLGPDDISGVLDFAMLSGYDFTREDYMKAVREYEAHEPVAAGGGPMSRLPGFHHS